MSRPKILVSRKLPAAVESAAARDFDVTLNATDTPLDRPAMQRALREFDGILVAVTDDLRAETLAVTTPRTRILANFGVGYSHIDLDVAQSAGIVVTNTPDVLSACTADLAMTVLMMVARRTAEGERELRAGDWHGWRPTHMIGTRVSGKTLGIVGFGRIGQEMAKRAHFGFGMTILVHNRSKIPSETLKATNARQCESLDELLPACDFVSLHCPGGDNNRHLIDAARLKRMKPTAILVNTARGEVVDEAALAAALTANVIAGAGLDVFENEPEIHPDLLRCRSAVLLPHMGSSTHETRDAMGMRALENLRAYFAGEPPRDRVV